MYDFSIWTPSLAEDNGQNIVTREVVETCRPKKVYEYQIKSYGFVFFYIYIRNFFELVLKRDRVIYVVISRSKLGFLRDLPVLLLQYFSKVVVVHCHGSDIIDLLKTPILGVVAQLLYRRLTFIVPSKHIFEVLLKSGFERTTLIENYYSNASSQTYCPKRSSDKIRIIWNSNVMKSKGILKVCGLIETLDERFELSVYGKIIPEAGENFYNFKKTLNQYFENERITYIGPVKPDVLEAELGSYDVVILPSQYGSECQPMAIISAMCAGLSVVLLDTPALKATAGDYPAKFVKIASQASLRSAVYESIEVDQKIIDLAASKMQKRFSKSTFHTKMFKILAEARKL